MHLELRRFGSSQAAELYLTARPHPAADPAGEAERMFAAVRQEVSRQGAHLCRQRVLVPDGCLEAYRSAWEAVGHGPGDRWCSWLRAGPGGPGGIQAHAMAGPVQWTPLRDDSGAALGWAGRNGQARWALAGGICLPPAGDDAASTRRAFEAAERLLEQAGMGLRDVARTWFFLHDILSWYGQFNFGRNQVFRDRGLLAAAPDGPAVPASTGIGVSPACGSRLAMELFAVGGPEGAVVRRPAAGRQRCAYEYGSAFARVCEAATPGGKTVFVSGTAAIDEQGRTCHVDDPAGQIETTLRNVRAVLSDTCCRVEDVVEAIAYCKTPAVVACFAEGFRDALPWPWVVVVCDVCRDDLLFEVEVTAGRPTCRPEPGEAGVRPSRA